MQPDGSKRPLLVVQPPPAGTSPPADIAMSSDPVVSSDQTEAADHFALEPTPEQQQQPQSVNPPPPRQSTTGKPVHIDSFNTKYIRAWRRKDKIVTILGWLSVLVLIGAVLVSWISLGAPTDPSQLPFVQ